jgi:hypothetical protein
MKLVEVMKTSPPSGYVVEIVGDYSRIKIYIKRTKKPTAYSRQRRFVGSMIIGRSDFSPEDGGIAWEVQDVDAEQGYGPLLYDIAMEMVHVLDDAGIMPSMTSVSREARGVWKKYHDLRDDVAKSRLDDDEFYGALEERPDFMRYVYSKNSTQFIDLLKEKNLLVSEDFDL